jgi:CCR4-NOT transcriptional regulation complex NOT5 subunit
MSYDTIFTKKRLLGYINTPSQTRIHAFQIRDIQEDVDYYIDNCLEPDFTENDMIYDDIDGLEEMLLEVRKLPSRFKTRSTVISRVYLSQTSLKEE